MTSQGIFIIGPIIPKPNISNTRYKHTLILFHKNNKVTVKEEENREQNNKTHTENEYNSNTKTLIVLYKYIYLLCIFR